MPFEFSLPFSAIVGQEPMKKALLLNAIDPGIGGVLLRGHRGTAKSSSVRALAKLLPEYNAVEGCPYRCDPAAPSRYCDGCRRRAKEGPLPSVCLPMRIVELPINASEDRLVGSIDIEAAVRAGMRRFQPGVLADANRNLLYVDEVNLLDDHLVDVLLDAAAMGVNVVEREGMSVVHPAHFILVGTMSLNTLRDLAFLHLSKGQLCPAHGFGSSIRQGLSEWGTCHEGGKGNAIRKGRTVL